MKKITRIINLKKEIEIHKKIGLRIGFVPTMGALHEGHLSLIRQAKKDTGFAVVSVFVNPLQFGPREDLTKYPRNIKNDQSLAERAGAAIFFAPTEKEMYPPDSDTFVDMSQLTKKLCGKSRPRHFRGVMTVVTKLFNIVQPDLAYFGQKDYQQATVIKKMVSNLNMNLTIKVLPTVRESDGLAMSSRNQYLTAAQRKHASRIYESLNKARQTILSGETDCRRIISLMHDIIRTIPTSKIDYIELVDPQTLTPIRKVKKGAVILLAVFVGGTRLIDNIIICN